MLHLPEPALYHDSLRMERVVSRSLESEQLSQHAHFNESAGNNEPIPTRHTVRQLPVKRIGEVRVQPAERRALGSISCVL
jgi:hypothetical protein